VAGNREMMVVIVIVIVEMPTMVVMCWCCVIANLKAGYSDVSVIIISKVLYNLGLRWDTNVVN
jgi:hypothetical protein